MLTQGTLQELQSYVNELEKKRGFDKEDVISKCLFLGEEVGELFKSIRGSTGFKVATDSHVHSVEDELADVLILLCSIANRCGVDLAQAVRAKEERNNSRTWQENT